MMATSLVLIALSHQGWWYAGQEQRVEATELFTEPLSDQAEAGMKIAFSLEFGDVVVDQSGQMEATPDTRVWRPTPPTTRVPVRMRVTCERLVSDPTGLQKLHSRGEHAVIVMKKSDVSEPLRRLAEKRSLAIVDPQGTLSAGLTSMKVPHVAVATVDELPLDSEIVIVAEDALRGVPFEQRLLARYLAILVLRQTADGLTQIMGVKLNNLAHNGRLVWQQTWLPIPAIEWTAGEPTPWSNAIASFEGQPSLDLTDVHREETKPLVVIRRDGKKDAAYASITTTQRQRVILWQIPLGPVESDPRTALLLIAALTQLENHLPPILTPAAPPARHSDPALQTP